MEWKSPSPKNHRHWPNETSEGSLSSIPKWLPWRYSSQVTQSTSTSSRRRTYHQQCTSNHLQMKMMMIVLLFALRYCNSEEEIQINKRRSQFLTSTTDYLFLFSAVRVQSCFDDLNISSPKHPWGWKKHFWISSNEKHEQKLELRERNRGQTTQ